MKRVKSTLDDEILLNDETAEATDRVSAAGKLAFDGFEKSLHPIMDKWLNHHHPMLRERAITLLLKRWGYEKYFEKAVEMLHNDKYWITRKTASDSITYFTKEFEEGKKYKDQAIRELTNSLLKDNDEVVQKKSYEGLYKLIKNERLREDKDDFDRNQDVDWNLLQPYLQKYNLQKPEI